MHANTPPRALLNGRRVLFVLPPTRFDEGQFYQSWQLLAEEGAWLAAASDSTTGRAIGESGASVRTLDLEALDFAVFDALVMVEGEEEVIRSLERSGRAISVAVAASRTVAAFGRIGAELHAAGLPVVRAGQGVQIARFVAELAVRVSRQPRVRTPAAPEPVAS